MAKEADKQLEYFENKRQCVKVGWLTVGGYLHMMERTVTGLKGVHVPVKRRSAG